MYAIIESGGKQYKVKKDMLIKVEKLDAKIGDKVQLKPLLMADGKGGVSVGDDLKTKKVVAEVTRQDKHKKILVFKYKAKKQYRKSLGHRQPFTELKILSLG